MFKKMIAVALSALIATSVMPLSAFAAEISDSSEAVAAVDAGSLPTEKELVGAEEQTAAPEVTEEVTSLPAEKNPTEPITEKQTEAPVEPTTAEAPAQPEKEKDAETVGAAIESDEAVGKSSFTYSVSNNQVTITGLSDEYLTDLVIPDTIEDLPVTTIKENAFNGCSQVTSITVPNSVTSIGVGAFKGTNPTKVTLPFIGSNRTATNQYAVFGYIFGYTNDNISGTTYQYNNSSYYYYYYYIPKTIREVVITDAANIPNYAFYNCDWIESIQVNEEIKTIGGSAFYNCAKLTQFEIPDAVEVISSYAFSGCTSLETVNLPASLTNINEYAFNNCSALNIPDLVIPDGVTSIGSYAFSGCDKVTSITVPNNVTSIGSGAFKGTNPTKVTLPFIGSSRTATNQSAVFGNIFGYTNDNISGTTYQYNNSSYYYYYYYIPNTIKEVVITDAATVPYHAFYNCDWIEKVTINDIEGDASLVGSDAFYNCKALTVYINRDTAVHTYCERNGIRHCSTKSLTLEKDSLTLFRNETGTIGSEVILLNDKVDNDPETVWTSSDPEVAKVDRYTGVISAVAPGTATITADSEGVTATAQVTVYFKLEGITLNKTTTEIDIDKTETLTVIYDPDNTTDSREISWASSDDSIASVDENGVVTAHKKGNATITATGFGDVQASCTVQVLVPMTAITFDNSTITIPRGTRQKVPFTVSPSDTTDTYTVTSSDTNVATVDRFGNVTAKKIGTALITVQSSRGLEQTCVITVNSPASSIIISDESKNLFVGKSFTLTTEMSPKDSTDSITWTSTNEDVAVVTPDGQVTAIAKGSATIIATADSGVSAVCEVSAESDISTTTIYLAYQETEYDGSEKLPEVSVYYYGEKLVENTDYVLAYLNNLNAGDASVYVTSLYDGTDAERKFTINPLTIKALDISYKSTMTYTGSPLEALEEITYQSLRLTEGTDYKVRYENNTGAGPATMTVTGMGNFCDSTTKTYTIAPKSANLLTVMLSESSYIYDGNAKTPEVTVKDGNKTLAERTDYNVSYSKNIHAGDAVVTVTGLNNYGSATTVGFKIYPKSISNVTVRLDKTVFAYDGTEKCPVTRVEDNGIELTEGVDYRVEYKENQEAGTATATIIGQNDYTGTLATEFSIIQLGDIDRNGIVNIQDVTVLQRHLAEFVNNDGTPIVDEDDAEILKIADVDHSETITISDVTTIQRYLAEIIDSF